MKNLEESIKDLEFKMEVRNGILEDLLHLITNGGVITKDNLASIKERWENTTKES